MNSWLGTQIIERCIVVWNKFHTVAGLIIVFIFFIFIVNIFYLVNEVVIQ